MAGSRVKKALAEPMPQKPSVGPAYADEVLVAAICARVKAGVTVSTALECAGLNKSTWIRWQEDAAKDGANPTLVETVNRIARARGEAKANAQERIFAGDPGPAYWLQCQDREEFGKRSEVAVSAAPESGVAKLLERIVGDGEA